MADWQQIQDISMAVRTMDIHLSGAGPDRVISASCNLVNIARGHSAVTIKTTADTKVMSGTVKILVNKPLMEVGLCLPHAVFDHILALGAQAASRPVVLKISINRALAVSLEGDLRIDEETMLEITDYSIALPLK